MSTANPPSSSSSEPAFAPPSSILIVGSGVFGLGTAYALAKRDAFSKTSITVLDRSTADGVFPARDSSSIDSSRIVRADYADPAYAALAAEAQVEWRKTGDNDLGGQGRYSESGLAIVVDRDPTMPLAADAQVSPHKKTAPDYCLSSWKNVSAMSKQDPALEGKIQLLPSRDAIRDAIGTGGCTGVWGYINRASGWADAEASMDWTFRRVQETGRVTFVSGTASSLTQQGKKVTGVILEDGRILTADLVILATGAWTGGLIDLNGRAIATAQTLAYLNITDEEQAVLAAQPVVLNPSTGIFIIPPRNNVLKVARHEYGYLNPTTATPLHSLSGAPVSGAGPYITSLPFKDVTDAFGGIPNRSAAMLRKALEELIPLPAIHDRPFSKTRICWYTDTKTGDFLIDCHPDFHGLFIATGGNGHAFKFLPVLGERIADCVAGRRPVAFSEKWAFRTSPPLSTWSDVSTEDGSRGGEPGLLLQAEMAKKEV